MGEGFTLSDFGEGYCRVCRFILGLDEKGRLVPHVRGIEPAYTSIARKPCDGSGRAPAKVTPITSRKSAFSTLARTERCPECSRQIQIIPPGRWAAHTPDLQTSRYCEMAGKTFRG